MKDTTIYIAERPDGTTTRYFPSDDAPPGSDKPEEPEVGDWIHVRSESSGYLRQMEVTGKKTDEGGEVVLSLIDPHASEPDTALDKVKETAGAAAAWTALLGVGAASKVKEAFGGDPIDIDIGG